MVNSNGKKVALILSLTAEIDNKRVIEVYNADIIYQIKAKRLGVDCIKSEEDLKMFWKEFQNVCDEIKNVEGIDEISVFPAIPVSAAFEVGRKHMLGVHPIMHIFDDNKGFFKTITIGGNTINE